MCFSFRTSLISYTLGMLSGAFAIYTGQLMLGTLVLFSSQMQLAEAFIWKGIDENSLKLNRAGTSYGKYLLPTHNFAIGLGLIFSVLLIQKRFLTINDFIPLVIGIIFYGIIMVLYSHTKSKNVTFPANRCNQIPENVKTGEIVYVGHFRIVGTRLAMLFHYYYYLFFMMDLSDLKYFYSSHLVYYLPELLLLHSVGSSWCFSTAIAAPVIVGINWLLIR